MDHIRIEKIQAINRYKKQQLLDNIFLYSLTALTCSLFFSSPFWYPPLCSCVNVFLYVSLPRINSLFLSSKSLFIVGNLIVIFLVGQSKILSKASSSASDVYYDEYINSSQKLRSFSSLERKRGKKLERSFKAKEKSACEVGEDKEGWREEKADGKEETEEKEGGKEETEDFGGELLSLPAEELNKRADDFIARVNKQRKLEATLLLCNSD